MNKQLLDNYVVKIIEHGSLTQAAKALGISQPALSQGLNALEKEIGIKIFNRRANPITLTSEGELYYDYIRRQMSLEDDFKKRLEDHRSDVSGKVTIGAPVVYVESIVVDAVSKLAAAHPAYNITIRGGAMDELKELASIGKLDCFISTSNQLPEQFECTPILNEEICLCVPRANAQNDQLPKEGTITPQDIARIADMPFILLEEKQPMQVLIDQFLASHQVQLNRHLTVDQVSVAVKLANLGVGCCFASRKAVEDSNLCIYPLKELNRMIYVAYDKEMFRSQACKELMEMLKR